MALVALSVAATGAAVVGYYAWKYPFGRSPGAAVRLYEALRRYAEDHEGRFPHGELTPEASLALLYRDGYLTDPEVLRGKCVPLEVAAEALAYQQTLDPFTCGWHYEEGLSMTDDGRLALAWDKLGLGPDGGRVFRGAIEVLLVNGERRVVRDYLWDDYSLEQMALRDARDAKLHADAAAGGRDESAEKLLTSPFD